MRNSVKAERGLAFGVITSLVLLVLGAGLGWAGTVLLRTVELPTAQSFSLINAEQGKVERSIQLTATAVWKSGLVLPNQAEGIVTAIHLDGTSKISSGDAVFEVGLEPVFVIEGSVPAFRTMERGVEGPDVSQLQAFLNSLGLRQGEPSGTFDDTTVSAVRAWQADTGQRPTGAVELGSVLFATDLPAFGNIGANIVVGSTVNPSSGAVDPDWGISLLPASPDFEIALPPNQAEIVRSGMSVHLRSGVQTWQAVIGAIGPRDADGSQLAALEPTPEHASICADACDTIPFGGDGSLLAHIEIVPPTVGVTVPAGALSVDSAGTAAVLGADGVAVSVTVVAAADGIAVVEGLETGFAVRVPVVENS